MTSSPSATGPVSLGYATQGEPSTSSRARPSARATTAVTRPRLSVSITSDVDEGERHLHHALEILDGDPFVGCVDVEHAVGEVEAGEAALVEDVRVGGAAAQPVAGRVAAALERDVRDANDRIVGLEAVAAVALRHPRLDLAVFESRSEREGVDHFLDEVGELALVVRTRLSVERAPLRDDVAGGAAADDPDVRGGLVVDTAEAQIGDRARGRNHGRTPFLRVHPGVSCAAVEPHLHRLRVRRAEDDVADRGRLVIDVADPRVQALVIER